ncbi:MerR family transcriptional regulator [Acetobacterium fimetarium]|uniref:MerR family transcriptional regulator n=1 Tax=Acetobacterium fimetarium TaxID=52691 RepID=A0ABR6WRV7_9FIRM|nr:MerR family transcriptional regulator [Acetobacterium fimetarium]MBC3803334.1 MerR family transcriptional regulator [Acetobacterium fimetarium]
MGYYLRGELAKMAGINMETLRYYEKNQLIPIPNRSENGYRLYSEDTLEILAFIKSAKSAGFTLDQIRTIFTVVEGENIDLKYLEELLSQKILEIDKKMNELKNLQENLWKIKENLYQPHDCPLRNAFINCSEI